VDEAWRKIYRSLIFMDSWLSYTLGYSSEATPQDIQVRVSPSNTHHVSDQIQIACTPRRLASDTIDELIHAQTSKIGLIAAEIAKTLAAPELATRENVHMLTQKLETWRNEVPLILQLPTLTSEGPSELSLYQRRAILMVHASTRSVYGCAHTNNNIRLCTWELSSSSTGNCWSLLQKASSQTALRTT
jgi:hypothetical protein